MYGKVTDKRGKHPILNMLVVDGYGTTLLSLKRSHRTSVIKLDQSCTVLAQSKSSIQKQISEYCHTSNCCCLSYLAAFGPYQVNHCLDTDTSNFHLICTLHTAISKYTFCIGQQEYSQLSPGMILMSGVVHDTGILQS